MKTERPCPLCDGVIQRDWPKEKREPANCLAPRVTVPPQCWQHDANPLLDHCAKSQLIVRGIHAAAIAHANSLLRGLGASIRAGRPATEKYLKSLTAEDRFELLRHAIPPLRMHLTPMVADMDAVQVHAKLAKPTYPDITAPDLRNHLARFEEKLERRYWARLRCNLKPTNRYVARTMAEPIRLARFLQSRGIERWDVVRKRDIVAYLKAYPSVAPRTVARFMEFIEEHRPWADHRGRYKRGAMTKPLQPPEVLQPTEVDQLLANIRQTRSDAEYLLAWLVCKLGLRLQGAYDLTLDCVQINNEGKLVIRPFAVWVALPKSVEQRFLTVLDATAPGWKQLDETAKTGVTLFPHIFSPLQTFRRNVLGKPPGLLRASALFAAMLHGHTDRVTLHYTTGASIRYLTRIETLLSIDLHRRLDPDLVKRRNEYILGQRDA